MTQKRVFLVILSMKGAPLQEDRAVPFILSISLEYY